MPENEKPEFLVEKFTSLLMNFIEKRMQQEMRTFGFEYEFMPERILDLEDMEDLYAFFKDRGFDLKDGVFEDSGLPFGRIEKTDKPDRVIREFVTAAVHADVLGEERPFYQIRDQSFDNFLFHFTTVFTDIRLNTKGPALELRTPDSVPFERFETMWYDFMDTMSDV